jgi:hypothetical protein
MIAMSESRCFADIPGLAQHVADEPKAAARPDDFCVVRRLGVHGGSPVQRL